MDPRKRTKLPFVFAAIVGPVARAAGVIPLYRKQDRKPSKDGEKDSQPQPCNVAPGVQSQMTDATTNAGSGSGMGCGSGTIAGDDAAPAEATADAGSIETSTACTLTSNAVR